MPSGQNGGGAFVCPGTGQDEQTRIGMADSYLLVTGLDYTAPDGEQVRAEADDVRDDLPEESLSWLLEQGLVIPFEPDNEPDPDEDDPDSAQEASVAPDTTPEPPSPIERPFGFLKVPESTEETA